MTETDMIDLIAGHPPWFVGVVVAVAIVGIAAGWALVWLDRS